MSEHPEGIDALRLTATLSPEEQRRQHAEFLDQLMEGHRLREEAKRVAHQLEQAVDSPAALRSRASVFVRCADCDELVIAYITYVNRRAILWERPRGGGRRWQASYVDVDHLGGRTVAWCRRRWHDLDTYSMYRPASGSTVVLNYRVSHEDDEEL